MFCKIINRLCGLISFKHYKVYSASKSPDDVTNNADFTLVKLQGEDLEKMPMCRENERLPKFLKRLEQGHDCYGHQDKTGQICSYFWVSDARAVDCAVLAFDFDLCLPPGSIYIYDCRVAEEYRGKKLYTEGLREIMTMYRGERFLITAETGNIISQRGIISAGFGYIGRIDFVKVMRFSFARRGKLGGETFLIKRRKTAKN